jgi:hypothetical protein
MREVLRVSTADYALRHSSDLRVGGSNPSGRAKDFNRLACRFSSYRQSFHPGFQVSGLA